LSVCLPSYSSPPFQPNGGAGICSQADFRVLIRGSMRRQAKAAEKFVHGERGKSSEAELRDFFERLPSLLFLPALSAQRRGWHLQAAARLIHHLGRQVDSQADFRVLIRGSMRRQAKAAEKFVHGDYRTPACRLRSGHPLECSVPFHRPQISASDDFPRSPWTNFSAPERSRHAGVR
jgi:hypothetical protein